MNIVVGNSVLDVVVRRTPLYQKVDLVGSTETIMLGYVLKDTSGITPNWWAFGYYPNQTILKKEKFFEGVGPGIERAMGFATRRMAIHHMLRRCGYWEDS